jgi:hypothetical protein
MPFDGARNEQGRTRGEMAMQAGKQVRSRNGPGSHDAAAGGAGPTLSRFESGLTDHAHAVQASAVARQASEPTQVRQALVPGVRLRACTLRRDSPDVNANRHNLTITSSTAFFSGRQDAYSITFVLILASRGRRRRFKNSISLHTIPASKEPGSGAPGRRRAPRRHGRRMEGRRISVPSRVMRLIPRAPEARGDS